MVISNSKIYSLIVECFLGFLKIGSLKGRSGYCKSLLYYGWNVVKSITFLFFVGDWVKIVHRFCFIFLYCSCYTLTFKYLSRIMVSMFSEFVLKSYCLGNYTQRHTHLYKFNLKWGLFVTTILSLLVYYIKRCNYCFIKDWSYPYPFNTLFYTFISKKFSFFCFGW